MAAEYTINVPAPQNPTVSYLTEDALGSVRVTTNSFGDVQARRDFLPFGEELHAGIGNRNSNQKYSSNADDTRKKFATYQRDSETKLDFAQSRYYSPMQGRFTSPDEFKGGPDELFDFEEDASDNPTFYADLENPQSLNKYQYTFNNPYKYNDPTGHCPAIPLLCPVPQVAQSPAGQKVIEGITTSTIGILIGGAIAGGIKGMQNSANAGIGDPSCPGCGASQRMGQSSMSKSAPSKPAPATQGRASGSAQANIKPTKSTKPSNIRANNKSGKNWEKKVLNGNKKGNTDVQGQLTVKTKSTTLVLDVIKRRRNNGKIGIDEAKASKKARLSRNQKKGFKELEESGATVVGKGRPGYNPGFKIPPTKVRIVRPNTPQQ